jgi:hypothetical protein
MVREDERGYWQRFMELVRPKGPDYKPKDVAKEDDPALREFLIESFKKLDDH